MLECLPGFNVQANDALGMYEFGNSVSVRAFNFQQIGFVLDDIPMGRSDQFGGSPIYRYVDNENLAQVTASSGAATSRLPSYASLGPIVSYIDHGPADGAAAAARQPELRQRQPEPQFRPPGVRRIPRLLGLSSAGLISTATCGAGAGTIDRDHSRASSATPGARRPT